MNIPMLAPWHLARAERLPFENVDRRQPVERVEPFLAGHELQAHMVVAWHERRARDDARDPVLAGGKVEARNLPAAVHAPDADAELVLDVQADVAAPARTGDAHHELEDAGMWDKVKPFIRGGFWRNFKARYPETGEMYARMLEVSNRLAELRAGRHKRAEAIGRRLAAIGIASSFEGAMALAADPHAIGRTHFARYLVAAGIAADPNDAFKRYLCESGPGYVSHRWAELGQAIRWIRQAGGIAVLAHPARYGLHAARLRTLFREFRALGGEAVEVVSPSSQGEQARLLARLACEAGLAASAGSDFHFPEEKRFDLGQIPPLPPACRAVWAGWPEEELLALA